MVLFLVRCPSVADPAPSALNPQVTRLTINRQARALGGWRNYYRCPTNSNAVMKFVEDPAGAGRNSAVDGRLGDARVYFRTS
jgi:hypothetical protein